MIKRMLPFVGLGRKEWERLADASALLALALVVVLSSAAVYLYYGVDFRAFYAAGAVILAGGDPYDYRQVAAVLLERTGYVGGTAYYHPPWFCLAAAALALLPLDVARGMWIAANWGLFLGGLAFSLDVLDWRVRGWRRWLLWLSAFYLFGWVSLKFEQLGIALFFCLAWALWALKRGKTVQAGLAMALLLTKPNVTLLAFCFLLLIAWRTYRRATTWALAWLGLLVGAGTLLCPGWLTRAFAPDFWMGLTWLTDGPDRIVERRLHSTLPHWLEALGITGAAVWVLYGGLALAGVWWFVRFVRARGELAYGASMGAAWTLALTPYALMYDNTVLAVGLLWAFHRLGHEARIGAALA